MSRPEEKPGQPADLIPRLAAAIHADGFPSGDRAALKRMALSGHTPLSYHRFVLRHIPERWHEARHAQAWRVTIGALALQHGNPHDPAQPLGAALAEIGFAELRLESLLAAQGRVRALLALRAARRLAAERKRCNWCDFGWLVFALGDDTRERVNERVARDYYRSLAYGTTSA